MNCSSIAIRQPIITAENAPALVEATLLPTESHRFFLNFLYSAMNNGIHCGLQFDSKENFLSVWAALK